MSYKLLYYCEHLNVTRKKRGYSLENKLEELTIPELFFFALAIENAGECSRETQHFTLCRHNLPSSAFPVWLIVCSTFIERCQRVSDCEERPWRERENILWFLVRCFHPPFLNLPQQLPCDWTLKRWTENKINMTHSELLVARWQKEPGEANVSSGKKVRSLSIDRCARVSHSITLHARLLLYPSGRIVIDLSFIFFSEMDFICSSYCTCLLCAPPPRATASNLENIKRSLKTRAWHGGGSGVCVMYEFESLAVSTWSWRFINS